MWSSHCLHWSALLLYIFASFPITVNNHKRQKRQIILPSGTNPQSGRGQLLIYSTEGNKSTVDSTTFQTLSNNVQILTNLVMTQTGIVNELSRELSSVKTTAARKSLFAAKATSLVCKNKCIQVSKQVDSAKGEIKKIRKEMREMKRLISKGAKSKDVDKLSTKVAVAMKNIDDIEEQVSGNSKIEVAVKNIETTLKKVKKTIAMSTEMKKNRKNPGNSNKAATNTGSQHGQNGRKGYGNPAGSPYGPRPGKGPGQLPPFHPLHKRPLPNGRPSPPSVTPRPTYPNLQHPARTTPLPEPPPTPGRPIGNCESPPVEGWPTGHYCILANGPCPKEFNRHFGYMRSMALSAGDRDHILPMHFGNSKIGCYGDYCGQYLNWVGELFLTACCK